MIRGTCEICGNREVFQIAQKGKPPKWRCRTHTYTPAPDRDRIRLGVVGVRSIGSSHIRTASQLPTAELVAISDSNEKRLAQVGDEFAIARRYWQADKMFAHDDIDAVVLAVPVPLHAEMAIQAMEAGKHVLVEKPIARNAAEAKAMIAARDKTGKTLMVSTNQRFDPRVYSLKSYIEQGHMGEPVYVRARWTFRYPPQSLWERGDWFLDKELSGGGPLLDLGYHKFDLVMHLMGFPKVLSVSGSCFSGVGVVAAKDRGKPYGPEDMAVGFIRLAGNKTVVLEASYFLNQYEDSVNEIEICGTKGGAQTLLGKELSPYIFGENNSVQPIILGANASALMTPLEHFCNVLQGTEPLLSTPEQGLTVVSVMEDIYNSAESGEQIVW